MCRLCIRVPLREWVIGLPQLGRTSADWTVGFSASLLRFVPCSPLVCISAASLPPCQAGHGTLWVPVAVLWCPVVYTPLLSSR
jgi:hypothetical protein